MFITSRAEPAVHHWAAEERPDVVASIARDLATA
jgi:hypothetical protein